MVYIVLNFLCIQAQYLISPSEVFCRVTLVVDTCVDRSAVSSRANAIADVKVPVLGSGVGVGLTTEQGEETFFGFLRALNVRGERAAGWVRDGESSQQREGGGQGGEGLHND